MRKDPTTPAGTIHRLQVDSKVLAANQLGDPVLREVDVYVPHGQSAAGLPLLVDLVGFSAGGPAPLLTTVGFAAVRTLAEREGLVFVEGVKRNA